MPGHALEMKAFAEATGTMLSFRQTPASAGMWNMMDIEGKPGHWGFPDQMLEIAGRNPAMADAMSQLKTNLGLEYLSDHDFYAQLSDQVGGELLKSIKGGELMGLAYNPAMADLGLPAVIRSDYDAAAFMRPRLDENGQIVVDPTTGRPQMVLMNDAEVNAVYPFLDAQMTGKMNEGEIFDQAALVELVQATNDIEMYGPKINPKDPVKFAAAQEAIDRLGEKYLPADYQTTQVLHSTHYTFTKMGPDGRVKPVLGHPESIYFVDSNRYGYVNESQAGSWAEQQGLQWYEKWEQEVPTKEWDANEAFQYQLLTSEQEKVLDTDLISELKQKGTKYTPENILAISKLSDDKIVFLETGNSSAGLTHIIERHGQEFSTRGISEEEIPEILINTLVQNKIVGYQGRSMNRPVYETTINNKKEYISILIGDNGFIIAANFRSSNYLNEVE